MTVNKDLVSQADFESYLEVQESGVTNMWAVKTVTELTGLTKEQILYIMKNYSLLKTEYKV